MEIQKKYYAIEEENGSGISVFFLESNIKKNENLQNANVSGMSNLK